MATIDAEICSAADRNAPDSPRVRMRRWKRPSAAAAEAAPASRTKASLMSSRLFSAIRAATASVDSPIEGRRASRSPAEARRQTSVIAASTSSLI
jgi:hypothetical protein